MLRVDPKNISVHVGLFYPEHLASFLNNYSLYTTQLLVFPQIVILFLEHPII